MTDARGDIAAHSRSEDLTGGQPSWLQDRLNWFQDLKFGLFMHWGPYSQWGCIESWPLVDAQDAPWARPNDLQPWIDAGKDLEVFRRRYWALNQTFNPVKFDPSPWAELAWRAGMRYVTFTTKHHDGFCMFDTRTTDYRVTHPSCPFHSHPRANIAKVIFDAFRERGFGTGCYFSKSDWHNPHYWRPGLPTPDRNPNYDTRAQPEIWEQFIGFVHRQIEELMTGYGRMDILWLDGGQVRPPDQDIRMQEIAAASRQRHPGLIIADRTVGGPFENFITPEQEIPTKPLECAWESCLTMGNSWSYKPGDSYKPARTLIHMLVGIVAKGGNFLLNVGPTPEGTLPPEAVARLHALGDWMTVNAEAIHGTRAMAPYREGNLCYTRKGANVYAIVLAAEDADRPPVNVTMTGVSPLAGSRIELLGRPGTLAWRSVDGQVRVTLPQDRLPCEHAWVLKCQSSRPGSAALSG